MINLLFRLVLAGIIYITFTLAFMFFALFIIISILDFLRGAYYGI